MMQYGAFVIFEMKIGAGAWEEQQEMKGFKRSPSNFSTLLELSQAVPRSSIAWSFEHLMIFGLDSASWDQHQDLQRDL